ncbi:MAG: helix-turn-helix domain-containing protein [Devosiaceae bacterium]|nr:helix-turn-helix domain-containing protein [Devosiaceae bacterium]
MTNQNLISARKKLGLGPSAMAQKMGISYSTYYNWEAGIRAIPPIAARCVELLIESEEKL